PGRGLGVVPVVSGQLVLACPAAGGNLALEAVEVARTDADGIVARPRIHRRIDRGGTHVDGIVGVPAVDRQRLHPGVGDAGAVAVRAAFPLRAGDGPLPRGRIHGRTGVIDRGGVVAAGAAVQSDTRRQVVQVLGAAADGDGIVLRAGMHCQVLDTVVGDV